MGKLQKAVEMVDLILDGSLAEIETNIKKFLKIEHEDNKVPEVPADKKNAGKEIKDEIENDETSVKQNEEPGTNEVPHEPDESKTPGKDVKKDIES